MRAKTSGLSGWQALETACDVYLDQCSDPTVLSVLLRDGPRVVPPERFAELDREANAPFVIGLLTRAVEEGVLRPVPVELLARLLGAAFAEAGSAIAESAEPEGTREGVRNLMLEWLKSLQNP